MIHIRRQQFFSFGLGSVCVKRSTLRSLPSVWVLTSLTKPSASGLTSIVWSFVSIKYVCVDVSLILIEKSSRNDKLISRWLSPKITALDSAFVPFTSLSLTLFKRLTTSSIEWSLDSWANSSNALVADLKVDSDGQSIHELFAWLLFVGLQVEANGLRIVDNSFGLWYCPLMIGFIDGDVWLVWLQTRIFFKHSESMSDLSGVLTKSNLKKNRLLEVSMVLFHLKICPF